MRVDIRNMLPDILMNLKTIIKSPLFREWVACLDSLFTILQWRNSCDPTDVLSLPALHNI